MQLTYAVPSTPSDSIGAGAPSFRRPDHAGTALKKALRRGGARPRPLTRAMAVPGRPGDRARRGRPASPTRSRRPRAAAARRRRRPAGRRAAGRWAERRGGREGDPGGGHLAPAHGREQLLALDEPARDIGRHGRQRGMGALALVEHRPGMPAVLHEAIGAPVPCHLDEGHHVDEEPRVFARDEADVEEVDLGRHLGQHGLHELAQQFQPGESRRRAGRPAPGRDPPPPPGRRGSPPTGSATGRHARRPPPSCPLRPAPDPCRSPDVPLRDPGSYGGTGPNRDGPGRGFLSPPRRRPAGPSTSPSRRAAGWRRGRRRNPWRSPGGPPRPSP